MAYDERNWMEEVQSVEFFVAAIFTAFSHPNGTEMSWYIGLTAEGEKVDETGQNGRATSALWPISFSAFTAFFHPCRR